MTSHLVSTSKWAAYLSSRDYAGFIAYLSDMTGYNTELSCTQGYLDYYGPDGMKIAPADFSFTINNFPPGTILKDSHIDGELHVHEDSIVVKQAGMIFTYHSSHLKQCLRHLIMAPAFKIFWNDLADFILSQDQSSFCSSRVSSSTISS